MTNQHTMLDIAALEAAALQQTPYPYVIIPNFIRPEYLSALQNDFPDIKQAGSFPLSSVQTGHVFNQLIDALNSDALRQTIAKKLEMDLTDKPVLITVRGHADKTDGRIHTDSKSKLVTLLMYMNDSWDADEGRLRILYDDKNLDNFAAEVPPNAGTLLLFKVTDNGWHGHKPIVGERKVIQMNYLTDNNALIKHQTRHRFSAKIKQWARRLGFGGY